jgi:hypothetical protein
MMTSFRTITILAIFGRAIAHSWVERLIVMDGNRTLVGDPGYTRGAISRLAPFFNDFQMQYLLPTDPDGKDKICKSTQTVRNYTSEFPPLRARPGSYIAIQYQENGHVTLPELTPQKKGSGTTYVYGTSCPSDEDRLASIHGVWNGEGTGGDGRGQLLATRGFDDGRCYQINDGSISKARQRKYPKPARDPEGADLWCQNDLRLPIDISGSYSLYWVWDWPSMLSDTLPSGKAELYTSCIDIDILPGL